MAQSIAVYVASHKPISFQLPEYCQKMQVNAAKNGRWEGWLHDDEGDNISLKNAQYCELTALYSLWKNCDADIRGLFHYRRLIGEQSRLSLVNESYNGTPSKILASKSIRRETIISELEDSDIILPMMHFPYPTTALEDLHRFCYPKDILAMQNVIAEQWPDYYPALLETFSSTHLAYCNMFIARASFVDDYCSWLFSVLYEVEGRINLEGYDTGHQRVFGYLAEVLLNVYIRRHNLRCRYHYMLRLYERRHFPVSFARRIFNLLLASFGIFPVVSNRRLTQERYRQLLLLNTAGKETEQVFPSDPEALKAHMLKDGAVKCEIGRSDELPYVFAVFGYKPNNIAIVTFIASQMETDQAVHWALSESDKLRARLDQDTTLLIRIGFRDPVSIEAKGLLDDRNYIRYVRLQ